MTEKQDHSEAFELSQLAAQNQDKILYLVKSDREAQLLCSELELYLKQDEIFHYPEREILPYDKFSTSESVIQKRMELLNSPSSNLKVVVSSALNLLELLPSKEFFTARKVFESGQTLSIRELTEVVASMGYERVDKVQAINQFAVRGGVVDVFSSFYEHPLRIDFFADEIEEIREFDITTQARICELKEFKLFHGSEIALDEVAINLFRERWRDYFINHDERHCEIFQSINNGRLPEGYEVYIPFLHSKTTNLMSYLEGFKVYKSTAAAGAIEAQWSYVKVRYEEEAIDAMRPLPQPNDYCYPMQEVQAIVESALPIKSVNKYQSLNTELSITDQIKFLQSLMVNGIIDSVVVTSAEQIKLKQLVEDIDHQDIRWPLTLGDVSGVKIAMHSPTRPIVCLSQKFAVINADFYQGHKRSSIQRVSANKESLIADFENPFNNNEYVIHQGYGVGIYKGLILLETAKNAEEFIQIEYLDKELLYVPIRQAHLVAKYQVSQTTGVPLDALSSQKWKQKKEKAEKKAKDHAAELLDIESRRSISTSPQLRCTGEEYQLFADDFPYTLTSDQSNCIDDVIKDMGLIKPMNRVICGDVGFGKTEIAMRAAFVCVQGKKQAMILAPSTVLAKQHLESFTKRFVNFPMNIKLLTRHTSGKNRSGIYDEFESGKIDILIGTHALLNAEISLKNLGLLVVDEEHRFGTKQKEIIKSRQTTTHILYMSATPIPRTLNLVYSGLKDFSYLYTPPLERLSVKTFLNVQENQIIKSSLERELSRGGQAFIIQNDISKMPQLQDYIQDLIPNARIGIAHGKLSKQDINGTMNAFNANTIDVLICTTIVEMGLDIPNANTMIVIDAQNFGLSQLHQLRGRVGRSLRQAYCYLLIPVPEINKNAKNKLDSLVRHSDLGAGYFIAQEDLEIRGAGDFLGIKQSGHIEAIGLTMYLSMLKEAVNDLKGIKQIANVDSEINFNDRALIPEAYMPVANERLKVYRSLNEARSDNEIDKIYYLLKDRCGKPGPEVHNLIANAKLRVLSNSMGVKKIYCNNNAATLSFHESINDTLFAKLVAIIKTGDTKVTLGDQNKLTVALDEKTKKREAITIFLNELLN